MTSGDVCCHGLLVRANLDSSSFRLLRTRSVAHPYRTKRDCDAQCGDVGILSCCYLLLNGYDAVDNAIQHYLLDSWATHPEMKTKRKRLVWREEESCLARQNSHDALHLTGDAWRMMLEESLKNYQ